MGCIIGSQILNLGGYKLDGRWLDTVGLTSMTGFNTSEPPTEIAGG